ncbi:hypothetical protein SAMN06264365_13111 [Actinoplanes regularis]|uniref:Uncharacterized protein n=1 Tax=Actinoplanes regularis TaxID=52697 RepID=A0A239IV92_9ACTN|nr:hypothetical protein Are01nite_80490 [Actinoplanes regularis]SNS97128.1 hypothetical protein SAMN06264365_13111 [Actinoplanes regularis]
MGSTSDSGGFGAREADPERLTWDIRVWEAVGRAGFRGKLWVELVDQSVSVCHAADAVGHR